MARETVTSKPWPEGLPRTGLGAAPIGNLFTALGDTDAADVLNASTASRSAYIDTAPYYGHGLSEQRIGAFLRAHPDRNPVISTKVGRRLEPCANPTDHGFAQPASFNPVFDYSARGVRSTFGESLHRLGRSSVDLLLLHDIGHDTHGPDHPAIMEVVEQEAWPTLLELRAQGLTRAIGFGVNECEIVLECLERGLVPDAVLLAGRHTLLDANAEKSGVIDRCAELGVTLIAAAPFNSGLLAGGHHFDYVSASVPMLAATQRLSEICADFTVPLPAAALQFPLRNPNIASVVAGARTVAEVRQQAAWLEQPIPEPLWRALDKVRAELTS